MHTFTYVVASFPGSTSQMVLRLIRISRLGGGAWERGQYVYLVWEVEPGNEANIYMHVSTSVYVYVSHGIRTYV